MSMTRAATATSGATALQAVVQDVAQYFVNRDELLRVIAIASIAHEHVLLHGPKGCAKTDGAKELFSRIINAKHFAVQGTEEMPYTDLTGPVMFSKLLNHDIEEFNIDGYAYDAHYVLLDEYGRFAGGSLNKLLGLLNKDLVKNGSRLIDVILHTAIGTSNTRLTGTHEANADRFLLQMHLKYLESEADMAALDNVDIRFPVRCIGATIDLSEIDRMHATIPIVKANTDSSVWEKKRQIVKRLRAEGIVISDRRFKKANTAIAASAVYEGRDRCTVDDLAVLMYIFGDAQEHEVVVRKAIAEIANPTRLKVLSLLDEAVTMHRELFETIARAGDDAAALKLAQEQAVVVVRKLGAVFSDLEAITTTDPQNKQAVSARDEVDRLQNDANRRGVFGRGVKGA